MTAYRAGQRVRIELEGVLVEATDGGLLIVQPDKGNAWYVNVDGGAATVTVLAEPRPDEPTGLGAVVEAGIADWEPRMWVRTFYGTWACTEPISPVDWSELRNPVVLSEGWTP